MDTAAHLAFEAVIQREGSFTFVAIPFKPSERWGRRPRYSVVGTINGFAVRGTLGALGTDSFLRLSAAWLRKTGVVPGETVLVTLAPDGTPAPTDRT